MVDASISTYLHKLFSNGAIVLLSAFCTCLYDFFFPEITYIYGALAVFILMALDLITKLFSLSRINGGLSKAFKSRAINSHSFCKGTVNKLIVFGVMLIICGCAYRLVIIDEVAVWFTQTVFTLMFFRDVLSILENLDDAGCDVSIYRKIFKKKMDDYVENPDSVPVSNTDTQSTSTVDTAGSSSDAPL